MGERIHRKEERAAPVLVVRHAAVVHSRTYGSEERVDLTSSVRDLDDTLRAAVRKEKVAEGSSTEAAQVLKLSASAGIVKLDPDVELVEQVAELLNEPRRHEVERDPLLEVVGQRGIPHVGTSGD